MTDHIPQQQALLINRTWRT